MPSASASIWVLPTSQLFTPAARGGGKHDEENLLLLGHAGHVRIALKGKSKGRKAFAQRPLVQNI